MTTLKRRVSVVSNGLLLEAVLNHENLFQFGTVTFLYPSPLQNNICSYAVLITSLTRKYIVQISQRRNNPRT